MPILFRRAYTCLCVEASFGETTVKDRKLEQPVELKGPEKDGENGSQSLSLSMEPTTRKLELHIPTKAGFLIGFSFATFLALILVIVFG